jgi:hypothetical protein
MMVVEDGEPNKASAIIVAHTNNAVFIITGIDITAGSKAADFAY